MGVFGEFHFEDGTTWRNKTPARPAVHRGYKEAKLLIKIHYHDLEEI